FHDAGPGDEPRSPPGAFALYGPLTGSVRASESDIVGALHLHQPRSRAFEFERPVSHRIKLLRWRIGRQDELGLRLVKGVDQRDETFCLVALLRPHDRHVANDDRMEALRDLEIVGGTERPCAKV